MTIGSSAQRPALARHEASAQASGQSVRRLSTREAREMVPALRPEAAEWATTYAALVFARCLASGVVFVPGTPTATHARAVLGERLAQARSLRELAEGLPRCSAWLLADVSGPEDLWAAEAGWWRRLWSEGLVLVMRGRPEPAATVGAIAALAADAWRVRGALEVAARQGRGAVRVARPGPS